MDAALIQISPAGKLVFKLERDTQPKAVLSVTNISSGKVAFKVKTTQPTDYYVRPNQQVLDVGQTEDIVIILIADQCNKFLDSYVSKVEEKLDKHRFLVQSRVIEDDDFERIVKLNPSLRTDEYSKVWKGPKDDRKSFKLKVEFDYPPISSLLASSAAAAAGAAAGAGGSSSGKAQGEGGGGRIGAGLGLGLGDNVSENVEAVRNRLAQPPRNGGMGLGVEVLGGSPESMFSELQALRKKYDAVVEYTVHLTAERDAIVAQLETSQRELLKERSKKKGGGDGVDSRGGGKSSGDWNKKQQQGFSLFLLFFVAIISYLLGRYLQL